MAQREGSVFVYLFVATLVIVVALVAAVLIMKSDKDTVEREKLSAISKQKEIEARLRRETEKLVKLQELVASTSDAFPEDDSFFQEKLRELEEQINGVRSELGIKQQVDYTYLIEPYDDFGKLVRALKRGWDADANKAKAALENYEKLQVTTQKQLQELDEKNAALKQQLSDLEKKCQDDSTTLSQRVEELTNTIAEREDEWTRKELEFKKQIAFADNRIQQLLNRVKRCEEEKTKVKTIEDIAPDGQIIEVEPTSHVVWVNLGRKSHLRPGLVFRVYQSVGGKKQWKGSIEIRRVEDEYSEGRIIEELDPLNPLAATDYITSPFFDPQATPTFVFAGDDVVNRSLSLDSIKRKLQSYGARIGDRVTIDTDFLVALKNYEQTPEYQAARELGVTVLRETDLLEYIGR